MISIKNLCKYYTKGNNVLDDISLEINDGCIFGLVGINGAGKTTFLRSLCGVFSPSSGQVLIDNNDIHKDPYIKKDLFFLSDEIFYGHNTKGVDLLKFYQTFYNIDVDLFYKYVKNLNLNPKAVIRNFSKGMKRQLSLCFALAIKPKYLLIDEAFDGLDPLVRVKFKEIIKEYVKKNNTTLIISSHSLKELEDFVDIIGLLQNGKIEINGNESFKQGSYKKIQFVIKDQKTLILISELANIHNFTFNGSIGHFIVDTNVFNIEDFKSKFDLIFVEEVELNLEELFILSSKEKHDE